MSDTAVSRKQDAMDEAAERYAAQSRDPGWTPTQKLALACRILAREGHGAGLAGQMTARGGPPGTMWTHPYGLGFDEIRAGDYMLVDDDLTSSKATARPIRRTASIFTSTGCAPTSRPSSTRILLMSRPCR